MPRDGLINAGRSLSPKGILLSKRFQVKLCLSLRQSPSSPPSHVQQRPVGTSLSPHIPQYFRRRMWKWTLGPARGSHVRAEHMPGEALGSIPSTTWPQSNFRTETKPPFPSQELPLGEKRGVPEASGHTPASTHLSSKKRKPREPESPGPATTISPKGAPPRPGFFLKPAP